MPGSQPDSRCEYFLSEKMSHTACGILSISVISADLKGWYEIWTLQSTPVRFTNSITGAIVSFVSPQTTGVWEDASSVILCASSNRSWNASKAVCVSVYLYSTSFQEGIWETPTHRPRDGTQNAQLSKGDRRQRDSPDRETHALLPAASGQNVHELHLVIKLNNVFIINVTTPLGDRAALLISGLRLELHTKFLWHKRREVMCPMSEAHAI